LIEPPDPRYNPAGLPVGFAKAVLDVDRNRYACWKGDWVGFACASCHTGQLNYHGQQIRIEGGPAHHDIEQFQRELAQALAATASDPGKFSRFARRGAATISSPLGLAPSFPCYLNPVQHATAF